MPLSFPGFKSTGRKYSGSGEEGKLEGDLTIRGNTHPVSLKVEFGGIAVDPYGQTKAGFTVSGKISRKASDLPDAVTEAGGVVVADEIRIQAEVQLIKQAELVTA